MPYKGTGRTYRYNLPAVQRLPPASDKQARPTGLLLPNFCCPPPVWPLPAPVWQPLICRLPVGLCLSAARLAAAYLARLVCCYLSDLRLSTTACMPTVGLVVASARFLSDLRPTAAYMLPLFVYPPAWPLSV